MIPDPPQDPRRGSDPRNLDQIDLDPGGPPAAYGEPQARRRRGWWLAAVAILLLSALGAYLFFDREPPAPPPPMAEEEPVVGSPEIAGERDAAEPQIVLPPLDASDALVRELVARLSAHPRLAAWLASDELIRRFVVTVDNVAEGVSPRGHLLALAPEERFRTAGEREVPVVDPASYGRYDVYAQAIASLDTEGTVRLYRQLQPLIDQAYRDLGYPSADFDQTLIRAIRRLLRTPIVEGEIPVVRKVDSYELADRQLEALSPPQKHLLRTGPDNTRRIQAKLRELAVALGVDESRLPRAQIYRARGE